MHLQRLVDLRFQARWLASLCCGLIIAASGGCSPRFKCAQTTPPDTGAVVAISAGIEPTWRLTLDPQDVQIAIDPANSTVCYEYFGEGWQSAVFGTIDMTLQPGCAGPTCLLTMSKIELSADDFVSNGHAISEVEIWGQGYTTAFWTNDDTFAGPNYSANLYIGYRDNGEIGGHNDINAFRLSWGTLEPDYQRFCWQGATSRGEWLTANFNKTALKAHISHFLRPNRTTPTTILATTCGALIITLRLPIQTVSQQYFLSVSMSSL
jgi:hypothetical protein